MALPTTNLTLHADASTSGDLFTDTGMTTPATNGSAVAMWNDVGDPTNYAFGNFANSANPLWVSGVFNGLGALQWDATQNRPLKSVDDGFSAFTPASTFISASAFTMFISFVMNGDASNNSNAYQNSPLLITSNSYWGLHLRTNAGVNSLTAMNYDGGFDEAGVTISQDTKYVACYKHVGGAVSIDVNNGALTNSAASGNTADLSESIYVGANASLVTDAYVGEIAIYNADVTGTDLTDAWAYFMDKWVNAAPSGGNPWYYYAQQRVRTAIDRAWSQRGPLWVPDYQMRRRLA